MLARFSRVCAWLLLSVLSLPAFAAVPNEFSGDARTVLVTGANRGIGLEFVRQYADMGWNVIATCRDPESATELTALAAKYPHVVVKPLDLLDHAGIDALAETYRDQPIDILLNNAGLMSGPDRGQMVGSIDYEQFDLFYRVNAMGPLKVAEAFYPQVKSSKLKIMAALTTGKGDKGIPVPGFSLYKTSKAALDAIQKEIALRWGRQGIKVVTLLPGRVLTHGEPAERNQNAIPLDESIGGMITVMDKLSMAQSGHTIQWDGELID